MAQMPWRASLCQGWRCSQQAFIGQDLPQASEPTNSGQLACGSTHCPSLRPTDRPRKRRSPASGCLGLIKAYNRYEAQRWAPFPSFAKPHIRGAILHFLRDRAGLVRLPRAVEERAMKMMRNPEGTPLSAADALAVDHYRSKQHWVEFNDDLLDDRPEGIDLIERSEDWSRVNKLFRNLEKDDQRALQMVVLDGMSLRQTAQQLDVSAMTVQRRVKRGLNTLANELKAAQLGA